MNKEKKEEKLSVKRVIANSIFMVKYAVKYDRSLVLSIMLFKITAMVLSAVNETFILKKIIDGIAGHESVLSVLRVLFVSLIIVVVLEYVNQQIDEVFKARIINLSGQIQRTLIEKNKKLDLMYYDNPDYYDMYIMVSSNAGEMVEKAIMVVSSLIGSIAALAAATMVILTISPVIALFPICGFIVNLLTRYKIEELQYLWEVSWAKQLRKADYSKRVFYQPEYAKECKLTDVRQPLRLQFDDALDAAADAGRKYAPKMTWISLINWIMVYTVFSFFCVPAYLGYMALVLKSIALGDVAATNNAANYVRRHLDTTNFCIVDLQRIGQYAEKFRKILDIEPHIENSKGIMQPGDEDKTLKLEHVSFRYTGCKYDTLSDVSLEIKPGEKIAIVGENGAGKTTFVKLLMRLYDVSSGSIRFAGNDIRDYSVDDYRNEIGAVFQDYNIYGLTLAENVMMRKTTKEDEPTIIKALEAADFSKRLSTLPNGINTLLTREFSEEGVNLSGGESQKVAIARALAANADRRVVILDEPSSALDPVSEYKLNQSMIMNSKDATIIFISHRLSTTRMADRIYLFEKGKIKEMGTHNELMELNGEYRRMFDRQAKNYICS